MSVKSVLWALLMVYCFGFIIQMMARWDEIIDFFKRLRSVKTWFKPFHREASVVYTPLYTPYQPGRRLTVTK